jgi:hypothetical protein
LVSKSCNGIPMKPWINNLSRSGWPVLKKGNKWPGHQLATEHPSPLNREGKLQKLLLQNGLIP